MTAIDWGFIALFTSPMWACALCPLVYVVRWLWRQDSDTWTRRLAP